MPGQDIELSDSNGHQPINENKLDQETCQKLKRKGQITQPPNTIAYVVKPDDKLTSIAACFDTTPSIIKKINRLSMEFLYPDQVIYIPMNSGQDPTTRGSEVFLSSMSSSDDEKTASNSTHNDRDIIGCRRQRASVSSDEGSPELRSESSEQCLVQMFVKINSHYILTEEETVKGTLLVTPNAVMFDPNVSDPLVMQNGIEEYGMIAKLDTVVSAAIYRDSQAMQSLRLHKNDPSICTPEIFHLESCHLASQPEREICGDSGTSVDIPDSTLPCSCGADSESLKLSPNTTVTFLNTRETNHNADDENGCCSKLRTAETTPERTAVYTNTHSVKDNNTSTSIPTTKPDSITFPIRCSHSRTNFYTASSLDDPSIDYNLDDGPVSQSIEKHVNSFSSPRGHRRTGSAASSIYSVGMTSNTEVFVDYSCGIFAGYANTLNHGNTTHGNMSHGSMAHGNDLLKKTMVSNHNKTIQKDTTDSSELPDSADLPDSGEVRKCVTVRLEDGVSKEERPSLFQPISDLVAEANQKEQTNSEPYYLCLQVAQPINSPCGADTCPIEAYGKKKKPEYWFSISGEKVEDLYKFFIQWRPELYGEEITDEGVLNSKGFIAIPPEGLDSENVAKCSRSPLVRTLSNVQVLKGWEILSVNEILRQQSIDYESYISVPDMVGESLLLSDENIKKLVMCLPARVEGHRWRLAYSNEAHGFSLNTLYRNMCEFESATLVVILDDNDRMFGAFSSAPLHLCEHFYGTGECFLFTFVDGFKSYPWSGKNMFCVRGGQQALTFGTGSSACGLWLDADIYHGRTQHCDTFNNDPLTGDDEDFIVKAIEVWGLNDQEFDWYLLLTDPDRWSSLTSDDR